MSAKDKTVAEKDITADFLSFGDRTKEFIKRLIEGGCDFTSDQIKGAPWPDVLALGISILRHNFGGGLAHFFGHVSALRAEFAAGVPTAPTPDRSTSNSSSGTDGEDEKSEG